MGKVKAAVTGLGLGVFAMYFWDPERGYGRRKLLNDKFVALGNVKLQAKDAMLKDARNRLIGFLYKTRSRFSSRTPDDHKLVERVRAQLGRVVSHPGAIDVDACCGKVYLSGDVLTSEVDELLAAIGDVAGVKDVEQQLRIHESAEHISALQGGKNIPETSILTGEWKPGVALAFDITGAALALYGIARRGAVGGTLGVAGTGLLAKSWHDVEGKRIAQKFGNAQWR